MSTSDNLLTVLPILVFSDTFWNGFVTGIQDFAVEDSNCYESVEAMLILVKSADIDFNSFAASTMEKGKTATDAAYFITLFTVFQEINLVYFNMYADCYVELLLIQMGKITNNSAAAGNFLQTVAISLYETYIETTGNLFTLNELIAAGGTDKEIGFQLGVVVQETFQWTVPTFKVNEFGVES